MDGSNSEITFNPLRVLQRRAWLVIAVSCTIIAALLPPLLAPAAWALCACPWLMALLVPSDETLALTEAIEAGVTHQRGDEEE